MLSDYRDTLAAADALYWSAKKLRGEREKAAAAMTAVAEPARAVVPIAAAPQFALTAIDLGGCAFPTMAELKNSNPNVTILFEREADVDLQTVVDVINAFDKLHVTYSVP